MLPIKHTLPWPSEAFVSTRAAPSLGFGVKLAEQPPELKDALPRERLALDFPLFCTFLVF